jgi:hypothetical protein
MASKCLKWVGEKCVKWSMEDNRLTATINYGQCPIKVRDEIKKDLGSSEGFQVKIKDEKKE